MYHAKGDKAMAELVERKKRSDAVTKAPVEKKMKPFKVTLNFTDKIDALGFALCIEDHSPDVAEYIREKSIINGQKGFYITT